MFLLFCTFDNVTAKVTKLLQNKEKTDGNCS